MKKMLALIFILFLVAGCSEQPQPAATSQVVPVVPIATPTAVPETAATAGPLPTLTGSDFGLIAFYSERDGDAEIYVINDDGSDERQLTDNQVDDETPAWSPDGQLIAFVSTGEGNQDIYVMNADGSDRRRLTDHPANELHPSYSPDGAQIVFVSDRDGDMEIYVMDSDGRNPQRLTHSPAGDMRPDWSPDGKQIVFNSERDGNWEIYVMDPAGGNQRRLTENPAWELFPAWSPDGTRILYFSLVQGKEKQDIYMMNADGTNVQRLTNSPDTVDEDPAWSPDSRQIAFQSDRDGQFEIYLMDGEGNNQRRLTNGIAGAYWPAWNPGSFGHETSQVLPSILAPPGDPATIDGVFSPGEWGKALTIDLANGELLLMHAGDYLYLGIRSERLGLGSPCVQWADKISILHSSAALGTATYEKDGVIWQKTRDFSWTNRDTTNSQQALEERQEHLERENWLASNGLMGHRNEMEYQIAMTNGEVLLGLAYLMSPEYESTDYWPDTLGSGCRYFTPAPDGPPETVDFAPETWITVRASND